MIFDWAVLFAWLVPLFFLVTAFIGFMHSYGIGRADTKLMIIQITTLGNHRTVNEIIKTIHSYDLSDLTTELWVVTEPGQEDGYIGADRIIVVPKEFKALSTHKARALEYVRRLRQKERIVFRNQKILFLDDDSTPSEGYVKRAYWADRDVCEGIISPGANYGSFISHLDDLRTVNCNTVCSIFQGFGYPVHVHGEGLCVRANAEQYVTWNFPVFASEDLVFGHTAGKMGCKWGFFREPIYITSPLNWRDLIKQRRRWLWGNIHAVRKILSWPSRIMLTGKYLLGAGTFWLSTMGTILDFAGVVDIHPHVRPALIFSTALWLFYFASAGYVASKGDKLHAVAAAVLALPTSAINAAVMIICLLMGNPKKFEVIQKI